LEIPKHKHRLHAFHSRQPLKVLIVNTIFGNVFNHFHNCPITINLIVDSKNVVGLAADVTQKIVLFFIDDI
jgi:hypothetical protein